MMISEERISVNQSMIWKPGREFYGGTLLHVAAQCAELAVARDLVLHYNVDYSIVDCYNRTALEVAVNSSGKEVQEAFKGIIAERKALDESSMVSGKRKTGKEGEGGGMEDGGAKRLKMDTSSMAKNGATNLNRNDSDMDMEMSVDQDVSPTLTDSSSPGETMVVYQLGVKTPLSEVSKQFRVGVDVTVGKVKLKALMSDCDECREFSRGR